MIVDSRGRDHPLAIFLPTLALFCLTACSLTNCGRQAQNTVPPRYAVLRFENLSGDASLDWVGRAVSETLPVSLAGTLDGPLLESAAVARLAPLLGPRPSAAPGESSERGTALAAGANHAISGYLERVNGKLRITATDEDLSTGKSVRTLTGTGVSALPAIQDLARQFSPGAHPGPTTNEAALHAYSAAFDATGQSKHDDLEQAVRLDPNFGVPCVGLAG